MDRTIGGPSKERRGGEGRGEGVRAPPERGARCGCARAASRDLLSRPTASPPVGVGSARPSSDCRREGAEAVEVKEREDVGVAVMGCAASTDALDPLAPAAATAAAAAATREGPAGAGAGKWTSGSESSLM